MLKHLVSSVFWIALGHHPPQPPPPFPSLPKNLIPIFSILSSFSPIIKNKMRINTYALYQ